jgi:predicted acylesterase/phospholipase RssA
MTGTVRILSFDGGGIRGLIPAVALGRVAEALGIPGHDLARRFHLVAGTSTGGIMAAGLCAPGALRHGPAQLAALYTAHGAAIFPPGAWARRNPLAECKYDPTPLAEVLEARLGETQLSEAGPELMVTAWDLERARPKLFCSWRARRTSTEDFRLRDIARATAAAPTYFPPAIIHSLDANYDMAQRRHALVDGGVFANDPAALAVAEARRLFPRATRVLVLSLGTGARVTRIDGDKAQGFGFAGWLPGLIDVFMDGASALTEHELMLRQARDELDYFRLQVTLAPAPPAFTMDDVAPPTIAGLQAGCRDVRALQGERRARRPRRRARPADGGPRRARLRRGRAGPAAVAPRYFRRSSATASTTAAISATATMPCTTLKFAASRATNSAATAPAATRMIRTSQPIMRGAPPGSRCAPARASATPSPRPAASPAAGRSSRAEARSPPPPQLHLIVGDGEVAVHVRLPVLAHHDDRRRVGRLEAAAGGRIRRDAAQQQRRPQRDAAPRPGRRRHAVRQPLAARAEIGRQGAPAPFGSCRA